jgi:hypothetical protein
LIDEILAAQAQRLVLDSRNSRDGRDEQILYQRLGHRPSKTGLTYEHLDSTSEPLLWIPDAIGWCYGAGAHWRLRVMPAIDRRP